MFVKVRKNILENLIRKWEIDMVYGYFYVLILFVYVINDNIFVS